MGYQFAPPPKDKPPVANGQPAADAPQAQPTQSMNAPPPQPPPADPPFQDWRNSRNDYESIDIGHKPGGLYDDTDMARGEVQYQILMRVVCGIVFGLFAALLSFWLISPVSSLMFLITFVGPFAIVSIPIFVFGEPIVKWITDSLTDLLT